ncbi:hypothetical protein V8E55_009780 [Tylopilus felleus]
MVHHPRIRDSRLAQGWQVSPVKHCAVFWIPIINLGSNVHHLGPRGSSGMTGYLMNFLFRAMRFATFFVFFLRGGTCLM